MKLRLVHKLLIAMFVSTALVAVLIVMLSRASIGRGFLDFLQQTERARLEEMAPALAQWYRDNGDWSSISGNPRAFHALVFAAMPDALPLRMQRRLDEHLARMRGERAAPGRDRPGSRLRGSGRPRGGIGPGHRGIHGEPRMSPVLGDRLYLLDADKSHVVGPPPRGGGEQAENSVPIMLDETTVGWLGVLPVPGFSSPEESEFLHRQRMSLLIALSAGLLLAAGLAVLLARHLSRPVAAVGDGIRSLAAGDYAITVDVTGGDEIAALGRDVNRLASALSENETARQRWMADIAHELRTPLSILQGELEAMADGVRPMDSEQLASVQAEVKHINTLVDDLHQLALTDSGALAYKMGPIDLDTLVSSAVESFRDKAAGKQLSLSYASAGKPVNIEGDEQRLTQLLRNLLQNAVRYTHSGGEIQVRLESGEGAASLEISDSAPGVAATECERLFDRLYRVESSRNRGTGGSGLGLSICKNIITAHGGSIGAEPGPLGGVLIRVEMSTV